MKKILIMILPMLLVIALFFHFTDREFYFNTFLNIISEWEFEDSFNAFVSMRDTFRSIGNLWRQLRYEDNIIDAIVQLARMFGYFMYGLGQLLFAVSYVLIDFVDNILMIIDWLMSYTYVPLPV